MQTRLVGLLLHPHPRVFGLERRPKPALQTTLREAKNESNAQIES